MKLYSSSGSPFGRKVMACAISRGIERQITFIAASPASPPAEMLAANPLSKIPCLITSDGKGLFDSPVICEYLDSVGDGLPMFPASGRARWRALGQQALGDGIMDAAVVLRSESLRPAEEARAANMARQQAAIDRGLDLLERELPHRTADIGTITIACALGYLDYRFAHTPWRPTRPGLAAWLAAVSELPGLARTQPA
jgi:glutathione S-transferase